MDQDDAIAAYMECFPCGDETVSGWDRFRNIATRVIDLGGPNSSEVLVFADGSAYTSWGAGLDAFYKAADDVAGDLADDDRVTYLAQLAAN